MYPILIASADPNASLLVSKNRKIEMIQVFNRNDLKFVRYLGDRSPCPTQVHVLGAWSGKQKQFDGCWCRHL